MQTDSKEAKGIIATAGWRLEKNPNKQMMKGG